MLARLWAAVSGAKAQNTEEEEEAAPLVGAAGAGAGARAGGSGASSRGNVTSIRSFMTSRDARLEHKQAIHKFLRLVGAAAMAPARALLAPTGLVVWKAASLKQVGAKTVHTNCVAIVKLLLDSRNPIFGDWAAGEVDALQPMAKYHVPAAAVVSVQLAFSRDVALDDIVAAIRAYASGEAVVVSSMFPDFQYAVGAVVTPLGSYDKSPAATTTTTTAGKKQLTQGCGAGVHIFPAKAGAYAYGGVHDTWVETPPLGVPGSQDVDRLVAGEEVSSTVPDPEPPLTSAAASRMLPQDEAAVLAEREAIGAVTIPFVPIGGVPSDVGAKAAAANMALPVPVVVPTATVATAPSNGATATAIAPAASAAGLRRRGALEVD